MVQLSLREAAQSAGTSKSTILRAIKSGRMSAPRTPEGGYAIDPAELHRVYPPKPMADHAADRTAGQDATAEAMHAVAENAVKLAAAEAELRATRELLEELRQSRDDWRDQAGRVALALPRPETEAPRPWWRRLSARADRRRQKPFDSLQPA